MFDADEMLTACARLTFAIARQILAREGFMRHGESTTRPDALWHSLVEALPDVVVIVDEAGSVLFANKLAAPIVERPSAGIRLNECLRAETAKQMEVAVRRALECARVVEHEVCDRVAHDTCRWYEVLAIPLLHDKPVGAAQVLLTIRDVTDRRSAVETLEASERRFRALIEHGNDCIVLIDERDCIQYASPALLRVLGYEAHEMIGARATNFVHPDDGPRVDDARLSMPGESVHGTVRLRHKNGSWRFHEGVARNLLHDPAVRAFVCNRRDVTDRRLEEERLAFQAALLAQVSQPVVAVDPNGLVTYWNAAAERVFGWSENEVIGGNSEELLGVHWPDPGGYESFRASLESSGTWQGEMELTTKWGTYITVEASMRVQEDVNPSNIIAVMQDVTERKKLEDQLRQSQKMEAIGLLAGGVAHDFNNLLAVILGFSETAKRRLAPDHPVYQQMTEILDAAKRGVDLTRKLLAFSRKQIMQLRTIDLASSIEDFSRMLERIVGEDVELVVEQSPDPVFVRADPVQLEQVLLNLCTNARQAMPNGGRLRLSTGRVSLDDGLRRGSFVEIAVSDSGVGMDEATRARLFEPFFTTKQDGTGLGLATVYGIVEKHGGFIDVESKSGEGTTFRVRLPFEEPKDPITISGRATDAPITGTELILVAEDEPAVRTLIASSLTELGYRVIATCDGEEAVREYERSASDIALVVLDVVMPRLDARGAFVRMREVRRDVRVVFTTGYAPESTHIAELLEKTHTHLLEKPFTPQQLAEVVRGAIDQAV